MCVCVFFHCMRLEHISKEKKKIQIREEEKKRKILYFFLNKVKSSKEKENIFSFFQTNTSSHGRSFEIKSIRSHFKILSKTRKHCL